MNELEAMKLWLPKEKREQVKIPMAIVLTENRYKEMRKLNSSVIS